MAMADGALYGTGVKESFASLPALFAAERDRWALWSPVLIGAGIAVYFAMPAEPQMLAGSGFVMLALLGYVA
jgi:competence protein ComEC